MDLFAASLETPEHFGEVISSPSFVRGCNGALFFLEGRTYFSNGFLGRWKWGVFEKEVP